MTNKTSEIAIKVENFSKKYFRKKEFAVENASFEVLKRQLHGFIGLGKTTTIKSLIDAYAPSGYQKQKQHHKRFFCSKPSQIQN